MSTLYDQVIDSVRLLSLDAEEQLACLPDWVHRPDELALILRDATVLVPQLVEDAVLSDEQGQGVLKLDEMLAGLTDAALWTERGVRERQEWSKVRHAARDWLIRYGHAVRKPSLDWISYIEGDSNDSHASRE